MTRYMQAIGLYLALSGFTLKELVGAQESTLIWILAALLTLVNSIGIWAARHFRNMYQHAFRRECELVERLQAQKSYELLRGYRGGLWLVSLCEAAVVGLTALKIRVWGSLPK